MALSIFMAPIEILSKFVKPFAFMVRLFGNMSAGHFVILTMFGIVFLFGHFGLVSWALGGTAALVVLAVMLLELLVAVLQAYVFALLLCGVHRDDAGSALMRGRGLSAAITHPATHDLRPYDADVRRHLAHPAVTV